MRQARAPRGPLRRRPDGDPERRSEDSAREARRGRRRRSAVPQGGGATEGHPGGQDATARQRRLDGRRLVRRLVRRQEAGGTGRRSVAVPPRCADRLQGPARRRGRVHAHARVHPYRGRRRRVARGRGRAVQGCGCGEAGDRDHQERLPCQSFVACREGQDAVFRDRRASVRARVVERERRRGRHRGIVEVAQAGRAQGGAGLHRRRDREVASMLGGAPRG